MSLDDRLVPEAPLVVDFTLPFDCLIHALLVQHLVRNILLFSLLHLVSELRVFLGDADLALESLLFVVQLLEPVFKH